MAFFFELFWLDTIPVGTFIPPVALFSTIGSLSLIHVLGIHLPCEAFVAMLVTVPFATLIAWIETKQRLWHNREFNMLVLATRRGNAKLFAPQKFIGKGIVGSFLLQATTCFLILIPLEILLDKGLVYQGLYAWCSWPMLWLLGSLGGVLSMRFRHGPVVVVALILMIGGLGWIFEKMPIL